MNAQSRRAGGVSPLFSHLTFENRGLTPPARHTFWFFLAIALLALPLFAHGCHGDDVDHEPFLIPTRLTPDDR